MSAQGARHLTGFARSVAWVMLSGGEIQPGQDTGLYADSVARWRAQSLFDFNPDLLALIYPTTHRPGLSLQQPPPGAKDRTQWVSVRDLRNLFLPTGALISQFQKAGRQPELLVVQLSSHGSPDGSSVWGNETFTVDDLQAMLTTLHTTYQGRVPVIFFADRCHAGKVRVVLDRMRNMDWRKNTYFILTSSAAQFSYVQMFREAWQHRKELWPTLTTHPDVENGIRKIFDDPTMYGRMSTYFLLAVATAHDKGQDGLDAEDICDDIIRAENRRYQPPINADESTRTNVVCDTPAAIGAVQSEWATHFAFTIPKITIGLDDTRPKFMSDKDLDALLKATEEVFHEKQQELSIADSDLIVQRCTGQACRQDWICNASWTQSRGYGMTCLHQYRRVRLGITDVVNLDHFRSRFALRAMRILNPSWTSKISNGSNTTQTLPQIESGPVTYAVLLDQSASMGSPGKLGNDPDGRKRRLFFDSVIQPAIMTNRVKRLIVAPFSDELSGLWVCFDRGRQPNVDQARRCFTQHIAARGGTNLVLAARTLAKQLSPHDIVFIVSDGEQNDPLDECQAFSYDISLAPSGNFAETSEHNSQWGPRYSRCILEQVNAAGKLLAQGRRVYAVYLAGISDRDALQQLAQIRDPTDQIRFAILDDSDPSGPQEQERRLAEFGMTAIGRGIQAFETPKPKCEGVHCEISIDSKEVDVIDGTEIVVRWGRRIAQQQVIVIRTPSKRDASGESVVTLAQGGNLKGAFDNGVTVDAVFSDATTTVTWSIPHRQQIPLSWSLQVQYLQKEEEGP